MSGIPSTPLYTDQIPFLRWVVVAFSLGFAFPLAAQSPTFVSRIEAREVVLGTSFDVSFTLSEAEGRQFFAPSFRDFKSAGAVSESRGVSIINGKTRSTQTWTYTLEPTRAGVFIIAAAAVDIGGRILKTLPLTIKVVSPAASPHGAIPNRDDEVFIIGSLSNTKVFPGQQVIWRLTLYTRVAIEGADLISLPDFDGFYSKERRRFDGRVQYQMIQGKKYALKILHEEALFPPSVGDFTIGAAQIRVGIDPPGAQRLRFGPQPVTLTAQPVVLNVIPLPQPAMEGFTGGVGRYEWTVLADTNAISTDGALTLTVTLKGNGDSRRFAPPKILVPLGCEIFEPRILEEEEYESEFEMVHTKKLEYVVLPKEPGLWLLTPQLIYYATDNNQYLALPSDTIRLEVTAGKNYHSSDTVDTIPVTLHTPTSYQWWDNALVGLRYSAGALLFALPLWGFLLYYKKRKKTVSKKDLNAQPDQLSAARLRLDGVAKLRHHSAPELFYNELLKSLQAYLAAKLGLLPSQMNHAILRSKLSDRGVSSQTLEELLSVLQTCEQAVFFGHRDASMEEPDGRAAESVVQALEKELR